MKKFVSVLLASGLILSLVGCSSNTNESIADEQTNVTVSEAVSEINSENTVATSTDTVTIDGWEYSLEGMSDEEVADLVFNTINSFHYGLSVDEWYSIVGTVPANITDQRSLDYPCNGYVMGTYPSEDYVSSIDLSYVNIDDNGIIQMSSDSTNVNIAQVEISIHIVDTERAQNIYNILKAKFAEVIDVSHHDDEDQDDYWQSYAFTDDYSQAWRVHWGASNEESFQLHADGMSENNITAEVWIHAYPGMEG